MYHVHFTVEGSGAFPTDMLRYDACYPDSSTSVVAMDSKGTRRVRLSSFQQYKPNLPKLVDGQYKGGLVKPCADRWASFGWRVVECWSQKM